MLAVTAIDRPYLPGLKALHNSILKNSPNVTLACLVYGDDDLCAEVRERGIEVVQNAHIAAHLPTSWREPVGNPAMYARLMVPVLFGPAVWLDADQVVLKELDPLFTTYGDHAVAAVPSTGLDKHLNPCPPELRNKPGLYAGLLAFNHDIWMARRITEQCFKAMNEVQIDFCYVVQSVLGYVLKGEFYHLAPEWQGFANRAVPLPANARVAHWHGAKRTPWTHDMNNAGLWKQYA